ncbi:hypothetical protein DMB42_37170 [Nonomuraea sp. WAC 01424]|uniref:hypothetical protein n=1 Tax=Nonomuraea sp. WAC 01424 TaxID=2203200 RepID=UPI000F77A429|nr:hypothetical protein [Nonomuraea sp. WAC 01424]RSN01809.1 hypothetical protein DMB42_37170 [Nonomuraea sp. WAC 01424]
MSSHDPFDDLETELTALGGLLDLPSPPPADVAAAVRARLETSPPEGESVTRLPAPGRRKDVRRTRRARWKIVAAVVIAVGAVTAATPQGRAAVARVLRFAGIELELGDRPPTPVRTTANLPGEHTVAPGDLPALVRFKVGTPTELGAPDHATVSDQGRVVSLFWPGGVRLDQFQGGVDPFFFKKLGPPWPEYVQVNQAQGWWIPGAHPLGYIQRTDGSPIPLRQAAPTLIWQRDTITYRLEGAGTKERAIQIAESLR